MGSQVGVVTDDARRHRRVLYPPADKTLIFNEEESEKLKHWQFCPIVIAYNAPRFILDAYTAGGLLGQLYVGIASENGGKWFHQWDEITVSYVDGRVIYELSDPDFGQTTARIEAAPLASAVGFAVSIEIKEASDGLKLVWGYGGANTYLTNYNFTTKHYEFSPEHCQNDQVIIDDSGFTLVKDFDESDWIMQKIPANPYGLSVPFRMPGWIARVDGGQSWDGGVCFGDPQAFADSPKAFANSLTAGGTGEESSQKVTVAGGAKELDTESFKGYLVIGMGHNMDSLRANPTKTWKAALKRQDESTGRIKIDSPDDYLNASATMIGAATEGIWGDTTIMHGGWSWRSGFLGWRGWYGPVCYGWTDRIGKAIDNFATRCFITEGDDKGALSNTVEHGGNSVGYNMNEVFTDHLRQYYDYTGDVELMRKAYPVLKGIVD